MGKRFAVGFLTIGTLTGLFLASGSPAHAARICPAGRTPVGSVAYIPQSGDRTWSGGPITVPLCPGVPVKLGSGNYGAKIVSVSLTDARRARFTSVFRFRSPVAASSTKTKPTIAGSSAFLDVAGPRVTTGGSEFMTARFVVAS